VNYKWTCRCCGKQFNSLPLDFACSAPDHWLQIPESERQRRGHIDSDVCIIDGNDIFVRGCLEIPVIGQHEKFVWGVWVSVSKESFCRIVDLWEASSIESEPPKFGWLCNNLSPYPATLLLKAHLYLRAGTTRPLVKLEATEHPLAIEQRHGISIERVEEIAAALLRH
jgi:hypothetical protein